MMKDVAMYGSVAATVHVEVEKMQSALDPMLETVLHVLNTPTGTNMVSVPVTAAGDKNQQKDVVIATHALATVNVLKVVSAQMTTTAMPVDQTPK